MLHLKLWWLAAEMLLFIASMARWRDITAGMWLQVGQLINSKVLKVGPDLVLLEEKAAGLAEAFD